MTCNLSLRDQNDAKENTLCFTKDLRMTMLVYWSSCVRGCCESNIGQYLPWLITPVTEKTWVFFKVILRGKNSVFDTRKCGYLSLSTWLPISLSMLSGVTKWVSWEHTADFWLQDVSRGGSGEGDFPGAKDQLRLFWVKETIVLKYMRS